MESKKCKACKSVYSVDDFVRNYREFLTCNFCAEKKKSVAKAYYENTKDYKRQYFLKHKNEISIRRSTAEWRKQNNASRKKYRRQNVAKLLLISAQKRAKDKSIPFDITIDDIIIPEFCPALGIRLEVGDGKTHDGSPSLDRIVPELGYVKGNVCVISFRANSCKRDASLEELENIVKYIKDKIKGV